MSFGTICLIFFLFSFNSSFTNFNFFLEDISWNKLHDILLFGMLCTSQFSDNTIKILDQEKNIIELIFLFIQKQFCDRIFTFNGYLRLKMLFETNTNLSRSGIYP